MIRHDSMRGYFAYELYQHMKKNKNIWLITGDLGYKVFDSIRDEMPQRFINTGAAEQAMMGIAVGLALEGKIPFVYSITTFLLYRPFETIRNYVDHEKIPVRLVGSGRDKEYTHDGFSHWSEDTFDMFDHGNYCYNCDKVPPFANINNLWPNTKEEIPGMVKQMVKNKNPYFLSLRR